MSLEAQTKLEKDTAKKEAKAEAKADAAMKKKMVRRVLLSPSPTLIVHDIGLSCMSPTTPYPVDLTIVPSR